jgi:hypothetical protein
MDIQEHRKPLNDFIVKQFEEHAKSFKNKSVLFKFSEILFYLVAWMSLFMGIFVSICLLLKETSLVNIDYFSFLKSIDNRIIHFFRPCISAVAISQFFIVSAITVADLQILRSISLQKELKDIFRNVKIVLLFDLVLSSMLLCIIIFTDNIIDTNNIGIDALIEVAILIITLITLILLRKIYINHINTL